MQKLDVKIAKNSQNRAKRLQVISIAATFCVTAFALIACSGNPTRVYGHHEGFKNRSEANMCQNAAEFGILADPTQTVVDAVASEKSAKNALLAPSNSATTIYTDTSDLAKDINIKKSGIYTITNSSGGDVTTKITIDDNISAKLEFKNAVTIKNSAKTQDYYFITAGADASVVVMADDNLTINGGGLIQAGKDSNIIVGSKGNKTIAMDYSDANAKYTKSFISVNSGFLMLIAANYKILTGYVPTNSSEHPFIESDGGADVYQYGGTFEADGSTYNPYFAGMADKIIFDGSPNVNFSTGNATPCIDSKSINEIDINSGYFKWINGSIPSAPFIKSKNVGTIHIIGGTVDISSQTAVLDGNLDKFIIDGGSVSLSPASSLKVQPVNSEGKNVYSRTVNMANKSLSIANTYGESEWYWYQIMNFGQSCGPVVRNYSVPYNFVDLKADGSSKLHLYDLSDSPDKTYNNIPIDFKSKTVKDDVPTACSGKCNGGACKSYFMNIFGLSTTSGKSMIYTTSKGYTGGASQYSDESLESSLYDVSDTSSAPKEAQSGSIDLNLDSGSDYLTVPKAVLLTKYATPKASRLPALPALPCYSFDGWYLKDSGQKVTDEILAEYIKDQKALDLYAKWKAKK